MKKIPVIIKREYLTRVRKKSFIIMTLLTPILLAGLWIVPILLASIKDKNEKVIAVIDYVGQYENKIQETELLKFHFIPQNDEAELKSNFKKSEYYAFLIISEDLLKNPNAIKMYSDVSVITEVKSHISRCLKEYLKDEKLKSYNIEGMNEMLTEINNIHVSISDVKIAEDGTEKHTSVEFAMIISMVFGMLSYMFIMIYGSQVFMGVMQEKTSRIVEIIISSVKPIELMMGKIIGIAMVAITQFSLWIIFTFIIYLTVMPFIAPSIDVTSNVQDVEEIVSNSGIQIEKILEIIKSFNPLMLLLMFVFYFIGGYLLYASLYAAIGSAVDNEADAQQFMMPITIPIIIGFLIAFMTFNNPSSPVVFWGSIIPFTSPFVMMARISYGVPNWELILSMALLVLGFIFTTWFAARIYRTGILMYGKKVDYKEIWKWFRYSGR